MKWILNRDCFATVFCAAMSGIAYVSLQSLFLKKVVLLNGRPTLSLTLTLYFFFVTGSVACYLFEGGKESTPKRRVRVAFFAIVLSSIFAYTSLTYLSALNLPMWLRGWFSAGLLFFPALSAGLAYGWFFQIVAQQFPKWLLPSLIATAAGAITAGLHAKALMDVLGSAQSFYLTLTLFSATLLLIPEPRQEDKSLV